MAAESTSACFHVLSRSASAEMNTMANVAGMRPVYSASSTNATMLAQIRNQARHSGGSGFSSTCGESI